MAGAEAKPAAEATIPAVSIAANAIRPDATFACMPHSFVPPRNSRSRAPWVLWHPSLAVPYHRTKDLGARGLGLEGRGGKAGGAARGASWMGRARSARLSSGTFG